MEASGKSLGEARETALDLLGVAEDDAEFVVLSEPKAGLFGRLRGEARVQARVRPVTPPPKRGRRQRPERKRSGSGGGDSSSGDRSSRTDGSGEDGREGKQPGQGGSQAKGRAGSNRGKSDAANGTGQNRRSRGGSESGNGSSRPGSDQSVKQQSGRDPGEKKEGIVEESLTIGQQGEAARDFMAGLIREFGLEAELDVRELDEETVEVAATGDNLGLLVGPRGSTLSAVQDLTRTFVQRQSESRTDRILVDVGGYREKRSAALRRFTEGIVADVKVSGSERALEPMSAADRKVVHDAVNEVEGVQTRSEGDDPSRYVVIEPAS